MLRDFRQFSFFFFGGVFLDFRNLRETETVSNSKQLGAIYEKRGCVIFAKNNDFLFFQAAGFCTFFSRSISFFRWSRFLKARARPGPYLFFSGGSRPVFAILTLSAS